MKHLFINYNPELKQRARDLRNHSTLSEVLLWNQLKHKQIQGYDFHRQKPMDNFIVDFYCPELFLAIEIDGSSHDNKALEDKIRQNKLESLGIQFLRFTDAEVKFNMDGVLRAIQNWIRENKKGTTPSRW